ncbi:hypothetical protein FB451DRAFT_1428958 [Mycena latifolia]|nr:hypothetical protein FB451DRAFT_1428958 [Mycena latifolia]
MIHLDRNHHPSPLSATAQNKDLILPTNAISWSALDDDYAPGDYPQPPHKSAPGAMTQDDPKPPRPASRPGSTPGDPASASPNRDRSSSLSPAPSPRTAPDAPTAASRQSTPLSELSPPPDDTDDDTSKQEDTSEKLKDALSSASASPSVKHDDHDPQQSSKLMPASSPSTRPSPPLDSIATPSAPGTEPTSPVPGDPKVAVIIELNEELLKVCMELQKRGMAMSEPRFHAYSIRLQSNLTWSASVVDHNNQHHGLHPLPMMDPPPPLDLYPTERIQELYLELPTVFAKDIARRSSTSSSPLSLKRDRSEDGMPGDAMNKRRDTGESKMPGAAMMAPPPIPSPVANAATSPFPVPVTNGTATPPIPAQLGDPLLAPQNPGMIGDPQLNAASRDRARQAQMRAVQQQQQANRQMSPPSNPNPGMSNGQPPNNAVAGPSGLGSLPPNVQHLYGMLQTPNHPFVQHMMRTTPGFQTMPVPAQLQKMLAMQNIVRERQGMQNNGGGGPFPGQTSPVSPIAQMGGPGQSPQNSMFPMNAGMDLRAMNSTPLSGGGGGGGGGMNLGMMTPQQRQLLMMQQQQRNGGGGGGMGNMNPGIGMSPQQQMAFQQQQQERMRMEQQQRMAAAQQGGSPPHPGSPMLGNDFPALRSNASIPGIARIARSPSDGSPMTPRMQPARGPSMGAEDYQRAMMQQRGGMPGPGQGGNPGFNPQQFGGQQPGQGWQQNQLQQQMAMHAGGGGGGGGGGQYGMGGPRPGSGYGGVPSPPGSGGGGGMPNQNWGQGPAGGYPFGASGGDLGMQRQMSGTPAPQMQQNAGPPTDDFDPFSWAQ